MKGSLKGVGVALVTPFLANKTVDYSGLECLLEHVTKGGVDYLVVNGTTGESVTLTAQERADVLQYVKNNNPADLPIVFGLGGNNTDQVIKDIENAELEGVDAILSVSPYYNKPTQEGIIAHYSAIASCSPIPIILYNVPGRTATNIDGETVVALSKHENIVGIKEASGDLNQCMHIHSSTPEEFLMISGEDLSTIPILSLGGVGVISVLANAFPLIFNKILDYFNNGNMEKAKQQSSNFLEIDPLMYQESNPVGIKEVLSQLGICDSHVRLPLVRASESLSTKIADALTKLDS